MGIRHLKKGKTFVRSNTIEIEVRPKGKPAEAVAEQVEEKQPVQEQSEKQPKGENKMTAKKSKASVKSNNTTGYNGVTQLPSGKFVGQSYFKGKTHRTEQFDKAVDAAHAYDELVSGALAKGLLKRVSLNFPPKGAQ